MTPRQFAVLSGLAFVAGPFLNAQEEVSKGNAISPHQVPSWFVALANPELKAERDTESFHFEDDLRAATHGRPYLTRPKYLCSMIRNDSGGWSWHFCDM